MTKITKESLETYGMVLSDSPIFPMQKVLAESEEGQLAIVVTRMNNADEFALMMPGGNALYIGPACIEDLQHFEDMIIRHEPNY